MSTEKESKAPLSSIVNSIEGAWPDHVVEFAKTCKGFHTIIEWNGCRAWVLNEFPYTNVSSFFEEEIKTIMSAFSKGDDPLAIARLINDPYREHPCDEADILNIIRHEIKRMGKELDK